MAKEKLEDIKKHIEFHKEITEYERKMSEEKIAKFDREHGDDR